MITRRHASGDGLGHVLDDRQTYGLLRHAETYLVRCLDQVYIGGGGELATAREVLRHKSVEKCVMVDLDKVRVLNHVSLMTGEHAVICHAQRAWLHLSPLRGFALEPTHAEFASPWSD